MFKALQHQLAARAVPGRPLRWFKQVFCYSVRTECLALADASIGNKLMNKIWRKSIVGLKHGI